MTEKPQKSETPKFDKEWESLMAEKLLVEKQQENETPQFDEDWERLLHKLDFIKHKADVSKFLRPKKLKLSEIKPLMIIRSPRDLPEVQKCFDNLKQVDKLWIKYYNDSEAHKIAREWVELHPEYTHIILISDDVYVPEDALNLLLDDICTYDFPAVSGCSNMCNTYKTGRLMCSYCEMQIEHPIINVILNPFPYLDEFGERSRCVYLGSMPENYAFLTTSFREKNPMIFQCFFQGHSLCAIRRDIFEKHGCKAYIAPYLNSDDFAFAVDLNEDCIPQFADMRIYIPHDARFHKNLFVGKKEPVLIFEPIIGEKQIVGGALNGIKCLTYVPILVCTPFNNEEQSIDLYIHSLLNIDYPKELIDLVWVENDSVDNTWVMLQKYARELKKKYNYHSLTLVRQDYGLKKFGKSTTLDYISNQAGKNVVTTYPEKIERGKRLCKIYHYFFDQLQSEHKYIMFLFADVVVPMQIIKRYLEVFIDYPDAGWVGGVHHKRFPYHIRPRPESSINQYGIAGPLKKIDNEPFVAYVDDNWILDKQMHGQVVFEVAMTGHAWMMKPEIYTSGGRMDIDGVEIVFPIIKKLWGMGLKVYCASDIYLQHISLDGKIYRRNLFEELECHAKLLKDERKQREEFNRIKLLKDEKKKHEEFEFHSELPKESEKKPELECPSEISKEEKKQIEVIYPIKLPEKYSVAKKLEELQHLAEPLKDEKKEHKKRTHPRPHP
jgi:hypothetical protein